MWRPYTLIRALAICAIPCMSAFAGAAAEPSTSWILCTSRDVRLADQAVEACSAIIAMSDNDSEAAATAYGYRGIALLRRAVNEQLVERAVRDLERAVSSGLDTSIAYVFRGHLHFWPVAKQDLDLAIADYDEAILRDPQNALAFAARGAAAAAKGDPEAAAGYYGEAIRIDPTYVIAFLARARAYTARADWSRAAADLDQLLQLDSTSRVAVEAFTIRAWVRSEMVDFAGALADCDAALKLNASHANALGMRKAVIDRLIMRARAYSEIADWGRAAANLDQALQADSTSHGAAAAFSMRAMARYQMSDLAGAMADCEQALKLNPRDAQALRLQALAHAGQKTVPPTVGVAPLSDALVIYVARGPAGACGETCEEWIALEGTVDWQAPERVLAVLDRLGAQKLPVVLNFRGPSRFAPAMRIGKILRERGFDATVGQTLVSDCRDLECTARKRAGKPLPATMVPGNTCGIACMLSLAGGVRRTVPDSTSVIIDHLWDPRLIGVAAVEAFRTGQHVGELDLIKQHLRQMGVDPQVADMMAEHDDQLRVAEVSRADVVRLRIVTTP